MDMEALATVSPMAARTQLSIQGNADGGLRRLATTEHQNNDGRLEPPGQVQSTGSHTESYSILSADLGHHPITPRSAPPSPGAVCSHKTESAIDNSRHAQTLPSGTLVAQADTCDGETYAPVTPGASEKAYISASVSPQVKASVEGPPFEASAIDPSLQPSTPGAQCFEDEFEADEDKMELVSTSPFSDTGSLPNSSGHEETRGAYSSPPNPPSSVSSPLSDIGSGEDHVEYEHDGTPDHRIIRLKPTLAQWEDFPMILSFARKLGAEHDGCFKVVLPKELEETLPDKVDEKVTANAYKIKQLRKTSFWQVSTIESSGLFTSCAPGTGFSGSADAAIKNLKKLFTKNKDRQLRNVRYRVDVPAWTPKQRQEAGVPARSPVHPLKGDKLEQTKAIIPGIHTPYVYESGPYFGATFQIHAEDFRLVSLNHLYKGRKIWIVIPVTAVDIAERALGRGIKCSQFMRHRAEFFFPDKLEKLGIPYRIVDQRPGETIVILPDAYHEGFSTGYTIAEAKNYADPDWSTETYQPCEASCKLMTAIPASFMRLIEDGEEQLDLCRYYEVDSTPLLAATVPMEATAPTAATAATAPTAPTALTAPTAPTEATTDLEPREPEAQDTEPLLPSPLSKRGYEDTGMNIMDGQDMKRIKV